jgi:hypothetical protein
MKVVYYLLFVIFLITIMLSCNQSNNKKQKSNEYEQIPQEEQKQMPEQSKQNPNPFQQPSQATKVSDKELEQFAEAAQQVQIINQEVQKRMINKLEENELDVQRFNEIQQAQQNPQQEINATKEEIKKYEASSREFEKIQVQAHQKMQQQITASGLTLPRYEEITMILQSDLELQEKFQKIQIQQQNN